MRLPERVAIPTLSLSLRSRLSHHLLLSPPPFSPFFQPSFQAKLNGKTSSGQMTYTVSCVRYVSPSLSTPRHRAQQRFAARRCPLFWCWCLVAWGACEEELRQACSHVVDWLAFQGDCRPFNSPSGLRTVFFCGHLSARQSRPAA